MNLGVPKSKNSHSQFGTIDLTLTNALQDALLVSDEVESKCLPSVLQNRVDSRENLRLLVQVASLQL